MEHDVEDDVATIKIYPVRLKRITGWATECLDCVQASVARDKRTAQKNAVGHARASHGGDATLKEYTK